MDDRHLGIYLEEVVHQWKIANHAFQILSATLYGDDPNTADPVVKVLASAQSILTAGSQISKLISPSAPRGASAERKALAVDRAESVQAVIEASDVLRSRTVRNSVEHFDERLDQMFFDNSHISTADVNVLPHGELEHPDIQILRNFDPNRYEYRALDDAVSILGLLSAIEDAAMKAQTWLDSEHQRKFGTHLDWMAEVESNLRSLLDSVSGRNERPGIRDDDRLAGEQVDRSETSEQ